MATDADYEYYQVYGNQTNNQIIALFNNIEEEYTDEFNIEIAIVYQHVWTTSSDPYSASSDQGAINTEISNAWNTGVYGYVGRDLVHLFTGKNLSNYSTGRASGIGDLCTNPNANSYTKDRANSFSTLAHEIGHNLGGVHGDGVNCGAGSTTASVMCSGPKSIPIYFSYASTNRINNYINNNSSCLQRVDNVSIQGNKHICINQNKTYNLDTHADGLVTWTLSNSKASIVSGQGTKTVSIKGISSGSVALSANMAINGEDCNSRSISKNLTIGVPTITLNSTGTGPYGQVDVYVSGASGASNFKYYRDGTLIYTTSLNSATIPFGCNGGMLTAEAVTPCGSSYDSDYISPGCASSSYNYKPYPNPANESVYIKEAESVQKSMDDQKNEELNLELYDGSKNLVRSAKISPDAHEKKLNISGLRKGIYYLRIQTQTTEEVHRIIVE